MRLGVPVQQPQLPAHKYETIHVLQALLKSLDGSRAACEAHPEASSDLELVQSLWIQEVPKK